MSEKSYTLTSGCVECMNQKIKNIINIYCTFSDSTGLRTSTPALPVLGLHRVSKEVLFWNVSDTQPRHKCPVWDSNLVAHCGTSLKTEQICDKRLICIFTTSILLLVQVHAWNTCKGILWFSDWQRFGFIFSTQFGLPDLWSLARIYSKHVAQHGDVKKVQIGKHARNRGACQTVWQHCPSV